MWALSWENLSYAICEQPRCRSACASAQSDQHLYCSLLRWCNTYSCYVQNFKTLASFCSWAGGFVSPGHKPPKTGFLMTWLMWYSTCKFHFDCKFRIRSLALQPLFIRERKRIEPSHDKTNKMTVRPGKTQISLGIGAFSGHSMGS